MRRRSPIHLAEEPLPPLAEIERSWVELERHADPSFFTSWAWIGTWLETVPGREGMTLLRGTSGGATVALAILSRRTTMRRRLLRTHGLYLNRSGDPRYDCTFIEYNGVLALLSFRLGILDRLAAWFGNEAQNADELYLSGIAQCAQAPPGFLEEITEMPSYAIDLTKLRPTDGDLTGLLSANARQQLRRSLRAASASGPPRIRSATDADEALAFFDELKRLHIPSWERRGKTHSFVNPYFEIFHRRLIADCFAAGSVQMLHVAAGLQTLGYLYNFRSGPRIYAYQSGFVEGHRNFRPGLVSHALAVADAYGQGAEVYDFMAGSNRLKQSLATEQSTLFWQVIRRPRLKYRLEAVARELKRRFSSKS